jgi:integrase
MKRTSYQAGSVQRESRSLGPDVWVFRYMDGGSHKKEIIGDLNKFPTQASARKYAVKRIAEINEERSCVRVKGLCERFKKEDLDIRAKSQKTYHGFLKRVKEGLGEYRLDELTPIVMEQWINELEKVKGGGLSKKTKLHYKAFLHLLLEFAMKHQLYRLQRNPVTLVKIKGKATPVRVHTLLTGDQYQKLIADPDLPSHVRVMIQTAMLLGIRVSEVLGLKWDAIDFKAAKVYIRISVVGKNADDTKTLASEDELPLHEDLAGVLEAWKKESAAINGWLFGNITTGRPYWGGTLQQDHLVPAGKKVGIKALGWHDFRHTYRAMMGEIGVPPEMQMKLMRHSDITMSMKYGKNSNAEQTRPFAAKVVELMRRQA